MLREARIILPVNSNKGVALDFIRDDLAKLLALTFGGFTRTLGDGGYMRDSGDLQSEPVTIFDVAVEDDGEADRALFAIARWIKDVAEQETIYLRLANGEVHLV